MLFISSGENWQSYGKSSVSLIGQGRNLVHMGIMSEKLYYFNIALLVSVLFLFVFTIFFETITFANILNESVSIIYAGALSGGIAFTLQIYAQKNI